MATNPIRDTLESIGAAIIQHIYFVLESGKYPLDRRTSALMQSMQVKVTQGRNEAGRFEGFTANSTLELYALDYLKYVDSGRKPFARKVPIAALLIWIRKRRLKGRRRVGKGKGRFISDNSLAYAIQNSIYKRGIRGKNFLQPAFDEAQNLVEIYLDHSLLGDMTYELDRFFRSAA